MLAGNSSPRLARAWAHKAPSLVLLRRFQLQASAAADLVRSVGHSSFDGWSSHQAVDSGVKVIKGSSTLAANEGTVKIKVFASRATHTPAVQLIRQGGTSTIPFGLNAAPSASVEQGTLDVTPTLLKTLDNLGKVWSANDLNRIEAIASSDEGSLQLSDIRIQVDDFSAHRHPELKGKEDTSHLHELELKAREGGLFYHKVPGGNIGCYGYGAGVAMSTMDALVAFGGSPANFLDGGGGATPANVEAAMSLVLSDPDVDVMFINSFGGLTKTNLIAQGVVDHLRKRQADGKGYPPMFIRLRGTEENEARATLEGAKDLKGIHLFREMKEGAAAAVNAAKQSHTTTGAMWSGTSTPSPSPLSLTPPSIGAYESTMPNVLAPENAKVLIMGTGKASQFHNQVAQEYGTNIVAAVAPGKGGQEFLGKPVYGSVKEAVKEHSPYAVAVFVPPRAAADAILECIDAEIPLVVSFAEGIPLHDQLRVQARLRTQSKSRLIGANCPGLIIPSLRLKLGIQPLRVHSPGSIGLASRSGTISYELAALTTELGYGQSIVFGLGGDPFPGTRTWEALRVMLDDPRTELICLVGEIGGQMEEEAAAVYLDYRNNLSSGQQPKPVVGFIAGLSTERGRMYGHAGAIWYEDHERADAKRKCWEDAGFVRADTLGDVGGKIKQEMERLRAA